MIAHKSQPLGELPQNTREIQVAPTRSSRPSCGGGTYYKIGWKTEGLRTELALPAPPSDCGGGETGCDDRHRGGLRHAMRGGQAVRPDVALRQ